MSIQPLWLTYFIEILLVLEFQLTKTYFGTFSYKAHFRSQISSNVSWVMMFTCDPKLSTTCSTWYPSISRLTSGSTSPFFYLFKLQIFFVCFLMLLWFISYRKSMNWAIELSFCTSCINSFIVLCRLSLACSYRANYLNTFVASLYVCFSLSGSG